MNDYLVVDDFLTTYQDLKDFSDSATYRTEINPTDGVQYPHICKDIPAHIVADIAGTLSKSAGYMVNIHMCFLRRSPEGTVAPHIAHTDNSMGTYSFMLYLNDDPEAGTTFLRHADTGICYAPEKQEYVDIVKKDSNNLDSWRRATAIAMRQNRALVFDSGMIHCAEPVGGFGEGNDSRTVLTCFFS